MATKAQNNYKVTQVQIEVELLDKLGWIAECGISDMEEELKKTKNPADKKELEEMIAEDKELLERVDAILATAVKE